MIEIRSHVQIVTEVSIIGEEVSAYKPEYKSVLEDSPVKFPSGSLIVVGIRKSVIRCEEIDSQLSNGNTGGLVISSPIGKTRQLFHLVTK